MRNFFEKASRFIRQVWSELRRVVWPTRRQTMVFTGIVLVSVAAVAVLIWVVDSILARILGLIIG